MLADGRTLMPGAWLCLAFFSEIRGDFAITLLISRGISKTAEIAKLITKIYKE